MRFVSILPVLALFVSAAVYADSSNSNRQILPLGESEAFQANTGVGRAHDTGAVYYNPAGLSGLPSSRLSVSGSVYLSFSTQTNALVEFDNTAIPYQASGFNTIPSLFVAAARLGDSWTGAVSVLVPTSEQLQNRAPFATPNTQGNIVQDLLISDLWIGLSLSHRIDPEWSIGLSLFGIQHQEAQTTGFDLEFPATPTSAFRSSLSQENLNTFGISAIIGVEYEPNREWGFGLRIQTPLIPVTGKADTFLVAHDLTGGILTTTGESNQGTPAFFQLPLDFTAGVSYAPDSWVRLLADLSVQVGASYNSIPGSQLNDAVDLKPTPRLNLGAEFRPALSFPIRTGFYFNPSANGGDSTQPGFTSENFYGLTAGVGFNSTKVETSLGAFYIWSSGQSVPVGGSGSSSLHSHGVGGLLTTSYLL